MAAHEIGLIFLAAFCWPACCSSREADSNKTAISPLRNNDFGRISVVKTRQTKVVSGNRKKAPAPVTPDRRKAPAFVPPAKSTECAGSGGEDLGGVPPPTEYGKESGLGLTRQHPDGYGEFNRSAHSAGPGCHPDFRVLGIIPGMSSRFPSSWDHSRVLMLARRNARSD